MLRDGLEIQIVADKGFILEVLGQHIIKVVMGMQHEWRNSGGITPRGLNEVGSLFVVNQITC